MINISIETHPELYYDYNKCIEFLKNIKSKDYNYPPSITYYHTYTEVKSEKELMVIKSYLATQNLEHTRLIVWSDYDISNNQLIKPFLDYIDFRVYKPFEEAKDTLLEGQKDYLTIDDERHWMSSGVLRFLVTHKYGGIWSDMDVVFLRDLKPLLDGEFAYSWGVDFDFNNFGPCAAFMGFQKRSELSTICLEEMLKTQITPMSTCFDKDLLAKVYRRKKFIVFPATMMDIEWVKNTQYINGKKHYDPNGLGTQIEHQWFVNPLQNLEWVHPECMVWHWHHTSHKYDIIHPQSKFGLLMNIIDQKLKALNILK